MRAFVGRAARIALLFAIACGASIAQDFPAHPIKLLVGFSPGFEAIACFTPSSTRQSIRSTFR